jgi:hypothetical protein
LITDVGNDLLYGAPLDELMAWLEIICDQLSEAGSRIVVTSLPLEGVRCLNPRRYLLLRTILFPRSRASLAEVLALAEAAQLRLADLAARKNIPLIPVKKEWYGWDTIHLRRRRHTSAWRDILLPMQAGEERAAHPRITLKRSMQFSWLAPAERSIFGMQMRRIQPCRRLPDGSTISCF